MFWPTEPGCYTARNPKPRNYEKHPWTTGAGIAARQWFRWKCWLEDGKRITIYTSRS